MTHYLVSGVLDTKPAQEDYPPFYHKYVACLPAGNVFHMLEDQLIELVERLTKMEEEKWQYRYQKEKWTVKDVLGHLMDTERVFTYRTMVFARQDLISLPGFDENAYVANGCFEHAKPADMLLQMVLLRKATLLLYGSFGQEVLALSGTANGASFTVKSKVFITAGHFQHHSNILRDRYGI